jgi:hypothetical protein
MDFFVTASVEASYDMRGKEHQILLFVFCKWRLVGAFGGPCSAVLHLFRKGCYFDLLAM